MIKQTHHSLYRLATRAGITNTKEATNQILAAKKNGASPEDFPDCPFKNFLLEKGQTKKLKVYRGYIYIFNKNSRRAITVYKVPDRFRPDLDDIVQSGYIALKKIV